MLAAIAIGRYFNVSAKNIDNAISAYESDMNRSQKIERNNYTIYLDAYNANPSSMKVAVENFKMIDKNRKTVILGDMFELGATQLEEHQAIVDIVEKLGFDNVYFVGELFFKTKANSMLFKNFEELFTKLKTNPLKNQSILIKGSRGMQLERLLEVIN